jgi:hypothetical protein
VELAFAHIALVLFVTVANAGINVLGLNAKDLDAVIKEHAVVQHFKL